MTALRSIEADGGGAARRYHGVAIALHWVIGGLIFVNLALGLLHERLEAAAGWQAIPLHKSIGLTVLALSLVRLGWRLTHRPPPLPRDVGGAEQGVAHGVHWLLYVLMILMPLTGWIMSSAGKYPLDWFGLFAVPKFAVTKGDAIVGLSGGGHLYLGWLLLALAVGHAAAALRHHFLLRDTILARMLPLAERD